MMKLKLFRPSVTVLLLLLLSNTGFAQKDVERFDVGDNMEVSVNSSYTNIIFETWNKNKVEVEAFIDNDKLSDSEKKDLMKNWDLSIVGNSKKVTINSNSGNTGMESISAIPLPNMDFIGPLIEDMVMPMIANIQVPPLPDDLMKNIGNIQFDYEAYKKDEKGYMKKFDAQMDKKFGKDFQKKMEDWGKKFEKSWDDKKADSIGEAYGKKMEAWGEAYGKKMEAWGDEIAKKYEKEGDNYTKTVTKSPNGTSIIIQGNRSVNGANANKTIIIRMPKNTKSNVNVRHGDLKMADVNNVKATLDYTPFKANSIDGGQTLINASYGAVAVKNWKQGTLNVKFVDDCNIETTENINLQANSSDVKIGNLTKQAFLSGSFGDLTIEKIADSFETLDIHLKNTDAILNIPAAAFSFYFNGKKSNLKYPKSLQLNETKNADRVIAKAFNQSNSSNKTVTIDATYSDVTLR